MNLESAAATFAHETWAPRIVGRVNDYDVRVANVAGEHMWHTHESTDEFFLVVAGELTISLRTAAGDAAVTLAVGDTYTVPRNTEHRPAAVPGTVIMMFEPSGTATVGDSPDSVPAHISATIAVPLLS